MSLGGLMSGLSISKYQKSKKVQIYILKISSLSLFFFLCMTIVTTYRNNVMTISYCLKDLKI